MRRPKDLGQTGLILRDPVRGGQGSGGFVVAFARDVLLSDDDDHAGEETLEDVEDIAHGSVVAEGGECRAVKNHLPLNPPLGREEGGCMDGNLDAQGGGAGQAVRGFEGARALDAEEHAGVDGGDIAPAVLVDEVGL